MEYILANKYTFIFVLVRVSMILTFGVLYSDKRVSKPFKIALIFLITMVLTPVVPTDRIVNISEYDFVSILITEAILGFIIGFISNMITHTIIMAGSIIDTQGGFGMAQIFDPTTHSQTSVVAQLMLLVGSLCFLLNNFHITFLSIVMDSFKFIPIGEVIDLTSVIQVVVSCISISLCISLPIIGIIFMIDVILGISTKTMPQLNLFSVGFIVKICATMVLMYMYIFILNNVVTMVTSVIFDFLSNLS